MYSYFIEYLLNNCNICMLDFIPAMKQLTSLSDVEWVLYVVFRGHKYQWEGLHYRIQPAMGWEIFIAYSSSKHVGVHEKILR